MTILQLKLAVATAELKSVSGAAKLLNTSQPNASNSLKALEEEVGFPIFLRTSAGASVTPKGDKFILYARQMLDANDRAMNLRNEEETYRLRLATVDYYAAAEPFFDLCAEHKDDAKTDFRYCSASIPEGIQALVNHDLDVLAVAVLQHQIPGLQHACKKAGLELTSICQIPTVIQVRKDHPAALDGRCKNITQGCDLMKDYPYIGLRHMADESSSVAYNDSDFAQCSYKIFVDDTNVRLRVIESTNGFGFGLLSSYKLMNQFNIEKYPVKGVLAELFCINRPREADRREIREYTTLLKLDMLQLLKTGLTP